MTNYISSEPTALTRPKWQHDASHRILSRIFQGFIWCLCQVIKFWNYMIKFWNCMSWPLVAHAFKTRVDKVEKISNWRLSLTAMGSNFTGKIEDNNLLVIYFIQSRNYVVNLLKLWDWYKKVNEWPFVICD